MPLIRFTTKPVRLAHTEAAIKTPQPRPEAAIKTPQPQPEAAIRTP